NRSAEVHAGDARRRRVCRPAGYPWRVDDRWYGGRLALPADAINRLGRRDRNGVCRASQSLSVLRDDRAVVWVLRQRLLVRRARLVVGATPPAHCRVSLRLAHTPAPATPPCCAPHS